jgi:hypothetical protein
MLRERAPHGRIAAGAFAALVLSAVFTLLPSAEARRAANEWTGTWSTDWGTMVLKQSGTSVTGTYTHDSGHITGTAAGLVVTGRWDEAPTRKGPRDAGTITFTMSADLRTFSGSWTYDGGGGGTWIGTRTSPLPGTTTTTATTTTEDTERPVVGAVALVGVFTPGSRVRLQFVVKDDSGKAKVAIALYDGGARGRGTVLGPLPAVGKRGSWTTTLASSLKGPLFFCVWAQDAAGNRSEGAPMSDCKWISLLVPIASVSNGCGGSGWGELGTAVQNYIGNTSVYKDSNVNPAAQSYLVDFVDACNLHDAGYGGQMVEDPISRRTINYRNWPRRSVDEKFFSDMKKICERDIKRTAKTAMANCKARGGNFSIGAESRYNFVRKRGAAYFDADVAVPGTQAAAAHSGRPWGALRRNN